jgi:hypothetical protein
LSETRRRALGVWPGHGLERDLAHDPAAVPTATHLDGRTETVLVNDYPWFFSGFPPDIRGVRG